MPIAFALDLSRLASRAGQRSLSGIDRVEYAWARFLLTREDTCFGLVRTRLGFLLLKRDGIAVLCALAEGAGGLSRADVLGKLRNRCLGRCTKIGLSALIAKHLPSGTHYLNLGHSNVSHRVFEAFGQLPDAKRLLFIHDVIPLSHPDAQTGQANKKMHRILDIAERMTEGLIFSTRAAMDEAAKYMGPTGDLPMIIAPLGPGLPFTTPQPPADPPEFVMIGTVEPRKNHGLILDIWEGFVANPPPKGIPKLRVIGAKGWADLDVFKRIADLTDTGHVEFLENASDTETARALGRSSGLLFPSLAEGFGLPALEAAIQGIPCICAPLASFHEVLGDIPVYVPTSDHYRWRETIVQLMEEKEQKTERKRISTLMTKQALPTWERHFNIILSAVE